MAEIHWTIWGSPLKIKISKIGLQHVLSWPKLGLEPKFHDTGISFWLFLKSLILPEMCAK